MKNVRHSFFFLPVLFESHNFRTYFMNSTADLIRRSVSLPKGSRNSNYTSFPSFKIRSPLVRCILSGVFMHRRDRLVPLRSIEISEVRLCAASSLCRAVLPRGKWNRFCGGVLGSHGHGTGILSVEGTKEKCILGGLYWNEQRFFFLKQKMQVLKRPAKQILNF